MIAKMCLASPGDVLCPAVSSSVAVTRGRPRSTKCQVCPGVSEKQGLMQGLAGGWGMGWAISNRLWAPVLGSRGEGLPGQM